ncbi:MAG: hypothetical protein AAGA42_01685 [Actinomycetota bacterium]
MADAPGSEPDVGAQLRDVEEWFVVRGVPHFVETEGEGILDAPTRALPILVPAYLLLGLNALNLNDWTLAENLATAAVVIVLLIATWSISNRVRGFPAFARPTDIDRPELALFVIGPAVPVLMFGQVTDALITIGQATLLLAVIYLWSSYGLGPLTRWAAKRAGDQFAALLSLVGRALPLLLLFNTFLFINAEVWEVAGNLTGIAFVIVVVTFFLLGATFALSRVPGFIRSISEFNSWADVERDLVGTPAAELPLPAGDDATMSPLRFRQKVNIALLVLFGQALQVTLVVLALIAFFVGFGLIAISLPTTSRWMGIDDVHILWDSTLGGRELLLTEPLLRVSVFLGTFSGMYFTVLLTTDATYRDEFSADVGPTIRQALAVRLAYRTVLRERGELETRRRLPWQRR